MITGLDHLVLICPEIESGTEAFCRLLGRPADWRSSDPGGSENAIFRLSNTALELIAPKGNGPAARRLNALLDAEGPGLASLVFRTDDCAEARRIQELRANQPSEVTRHVSTDLVTGRERSWSRFRLADTCAAGLRVFILQEDLPFAGASRVGAESVGALDHLVIRTPNPDRAVAFYGARLGIRLALDRTFPEWGMRLIFFRTGGLTLELAARPGEGEDPDGPDRFGGLCWRVPDIDRARRRLVASGFNVSDVRQGRRPGTNVFTVRDAPLGVATLFISHESAKEAAE